MTIKVFGKQETTVLRVVAVSLILVAVVHSSAMCAPAQPAEEAPEGAKEEATLAIEHFSVIEGTTWSGAHDRAGKRIAFDAEAMKITNCERADSLLGRTYREGWHL